MLVVPKNTNKWKKIDKELAVTKLKLYSIIHIMYQAELFSLTLSLEVNIS